MIYRGTLLLALVSLAALVSCGRNEQAGGQSHLEIVGGAPVDAASDISKSTVALIDLKTGREFCTGTLIGARTVLTAAHCVEGVSQTTIKVGVAFGLNAATAPAIPALKLTKHPSYNSALMNVRNPTGAPNDIAVVNLAQDAPASHAPLAPLGLTDQLSLGEPLILAGFGLTSPVGPDLSGRLRQVTTEITLLSKVRKELEFGNHPGRSACMGDSGGPAYVVRAGAIKLVGVTSRGSSACNLRGVYTDVRYFSSFIAANLQ